ncbi:MAG: hypothetical protein FWC47_08095 [Oscillospiraceae bacterium]|nr:hypothetical protein [Oscillospiraceae bacterium]
MENEIKNLIVLFPGANYCVSYPLLYYAAFKYEVNGYESIKLNYEICIKEDRSYEENIDIIKKFVLEQVNEIDFSIYKDILFVSKSLGTIIAGWLADMLAINIRQIYLTPVKETLQFLKRGKNIIIVIAGTKDKYLEPDVLKAHCEREQIRLELIEGVGHRLEIFGDMNVNIDILKRVVELY